MNKKIALAFAALSLPSLLLTSCNSSSANEVSSTEAPSSSAPAMRVENLTNNQKISENVPTQFRIVAAPEVTAVKVSANGVELGNADSRSGERLFRFNHIFKEVGDLDITFSAYTGAVSPTSASTFRVHVVPQNVALPNKLFNGYILKAVDYLTKNYGLLGYNIGAQNTHNMDYYKYGTLKPTKGGLTMCVAGQLEVIITAFELYAKETGNYAIYDYLPFKSWQTLDPSSIKAHIWVDPKLKSSGTADAITKFGLGERVKFKDLEPGSFININRTTGSGHAVTFLGFINIKGEDVPEYNDTVVGFRYFGAQGKGVKGEGGLSYRHAFFSKYGCPDVPYQRDCNIILSDESRLLNTGHMFEPSLWKKKSALTDEFERDLPPLSKEDEALISNPADFDGATIDD